MRKAFWIVVQVLLFLLALAGGVYVSITPANSVLRWYNIDDAFYYYKVAQNVFAGNGFSFDGVNLTNGFHPLWMVVCLCVFWLSKINLLLPLRVLVIVSAVFNAGTTLILFNLLKKYLHPGAAVVGSLIWALYPPIYYVVTVHGMESSVSVFFISLLILLAANYLNRPNQESMQYGKLVVLGLVGAFTILGRLDNMFLVGVVGFYILFKIRKISAPVIFDMIILGITVVLSWVFRLGADGLVQQSVSVYPMLIASVLLKPIIYYFFGLYSSFSKKGWFKFVLRIAMASASAFVLEYILLIILKKVGIILMISKSVMGIDAALSFGLILLIHLIFNRYMNVSGEKPLSRFWHWVVENWKSVLLGGVSYGAPIAVIMGIYMIYNKLIFGTSSPVSGQIKHWWSTLPNTVYFKSQDLLSIFGLNDGGPWSLFTSKLADFTNTFIDKFNIEITNTTILYLIFFLISVVLFLAILSFSRGYLARKVFALMIPAILLGCMVHITYYFSSGYTHARSWYWVSEMFVLVMILSVGLDGSFTLIDKIRIKVPPSILVVLLMAVGIVKNHVPFVRSLAPYTVAEENKADYLKETNEVEFYTEEGSLIGMTGGGIVAYFIENRTIVNLDGLINSVEYFDAMQNGTAAQFLDEMGLDYVYGKEYTFLESDPYSGIFKNRLEEVGFIRGYENFTLFKYRIDQ